MGMHNPVTIMGIDASGDPVAVELTTIGEVPVTTDGPYPATWYLASAATVAASATDNVVIYKSNDVSSYNTFTVENLAVTDPVDIYVSLDGTNFSTAAASITLLDDVTTGGGIKAIDIPVGKIGVLRGKFKGIKVLRKGTTNEAQSIRYAHGWE